MEMPMCATRKQAETLQAVLNVKLPGFLVREVVQGREPIPVGSGVPTMVTVHEVRKLLARHNQDVLVTVACSADGAVNIATAGNSEEHAQVAYELGQRIAQGLGLLQETLVEDRREEHKA